MHLLRYIRGNKTLGLNYCAEMKYAPLSDLLRKSSIKTEKQLVFFSDYSWQDFPDICRTAVAYIIFYQGGTIDHVTHVPEPVAQSSS